LASLQHEEVPDLERLAPVAHEELCVACHRSLMHAEYTKLANERVHHHLEDVREHVERRIGVRMKLDGCIPFAFGEEGRIAFLRIGRELDEHVEQLTNTGACARRNETHGNQVPFTQCHLEGCV